MSSDVEVKHDKIEELVKKAYDVYVQQVNLAVHIAYPEKDEEWLSGFLGRLMNLQLRQHFTSIFRCETSSNEKMQLELARFIHQFYWFTVLKQKVIDDSKTHEELYSKFEKNEEFQQKSREFYDVYKKFCEHPIADDHYAYKIFEEEYNNGSNKIPRFRQVKEYEDLSDRTYKILSRVLKKCFLVISQHYPFKQQTAQTDTIDDAETQEHQFFRLAGWSFFEKLSRVTVHTGFDRGFTTTRRHRVGDASYYLEDEFLQAKYKDVFGEALLTDDFRKLNDEFDKIADIEKLSKIHNEVLERGMDTYEFRKQLGYEYNTQNGISGQDILYYSYKLSRSISQMLSAFIDVLYPAQEEKIREVLNEYYSVVSGWELLEIIRGGDPLPFVPGMLLGRYMDKRPLMRGSIEHCFRPGLTERMNENVRVQRRCQKFVELQNRIYKTFVPVRQVLEDFVEKHENRRKRQVLETFVEKHENHRKRREKPHHEPKRCQICGKFVWCG
jgi:hypothetical protein